MILEGIVTTVNADGTVNVSPMGPLVDSADFDSFVLRPYRTSTTYQNLKRHAQGVLHVTDDVELIARSAINQLDSLPELVPCDAVAGFILANACRWMAFTVVELDDTDERTSIGCLIVDRGRQRDFFGFCRAKHAVVEAAILATRVEFLPRQEILEGFGRLASLVTKTGGATEHRAFELLNTYVQQALSDLSVKANS